MNAPALSVLIPAAGASRRLGQPKQLLHYRGETLIQRAIRLAASLAPVEIIVVTGAHREAVAAALDLARPAAPPATHILEVHNPDWGSGLGTSIATGAADVSAAARGILVMLCDQWRIEARDLERLLRTWRSDSSRIVCAQAPGHRGPPVIFPASCLAELCQLQGDRGAHAVLAAHGPLTSAVAIDAAATDLDTQADLETLRSADTGQPA